MKNIEVRLIGDLVYMKCLTRKALTGAVVLVSLSQNVTAQMLEEVVVVAQKRAESIQDVPLSVSALSADDLAQLRLSDTTQIASQIPNVQIINSYSESQPVFAVRGVTMTDYSQNQSSPVALYVDGVYKSVGALQSLSLYDVDRLEVLRGPQGTLYGKNATGGAVSVFTKAPTLDGTTRGYITGGIGNFDLYKLNGAVETSSDDSSFGIRAAFVYSESDGWVESQIPGQDDYSNHEDKALRISATWEPVDSLSMTLRLSDSSREVSNGYEVYAHEIGPGGVGFLTGYDRSGLNFFEGEQNRSDQRQEVDNSSASFDLAWDINSQYTFNSLTSFDTGDWDTLEDADGSPFSVLDVDYLSSVDSITQEFRLTSNLEGRFNFIVGAFGHFEELDAEVILRGYHDFAGDADGNGQLDCFDTFLIGCTLSNDYTQEKTSYAMFAQGSWYLTDDLELTAGIRYNNDEVEISDYNAWLGFLEPVSQTEFKQVVPTITDYEIDTDDSKVTYRLALDYAFTDDVTGYLSYTSGYRNSAINGQAFFDPSEITVADPEEVDAYELGIKSTIAGGLARINGAVFYYSYENQQFLDVTPNLLQILVNAEEATVIGAEMEVTAAPLENLELRLGLGILDTEYDELELQGMDLSGNQLSNAPELNFNAMVNWTFWETQRGSMYLGFDTVYVDDQFFNVFNDDAVAQEAYWVSNASLGFRTVGDRFNVALWVKNIADEEYLTTAVDSRATFNIVYAHRGRPRTYGLEATFKF